MFGSHSLLMSSVPDKLPGHAALQAVHSLHRQNRGHCDVKYQQIRAVLGTDHTLACCTLADLGSSTGYSGESHALFRLSFYCHCAGLS